VRRQRHGHIKGIVAFCSEPSRVVETNSPKPASTGGDRPASFCSENLVAQFGKAVDPRFLTRDGCIAPGRLGLIRRSREQDGARTGLVQFASSERCRMDISRGRALRRTLESRCACADLHSPRPRPARYSRLPARVARDTSIQSARSPSRAKNLVVVEVRKRRREKRALASHLTNSPRRKLVLRFDSAHEGCCGIWRCFTAGQLLGGWRLEPVGGITKGREAETRTKIACNS